MRKPNNPSQSQHPTSEIQNSSLRTSGLKNLSCSTERLEARWFNLPKADTDGGRELYNKYEQQDRKTGYNVLLKILGTGYDIDQYLNKNHLVPHKREDSDYIIFISLGGNRILTHVDLKLSILRDILVAFERNDTAGIKYLDEHGETRYINNVFASNTNRMIETEDGIYCGPVFFSMDGDKFLCDKKYFISRAEQNYITTIKENAKQKTNDTYQEIFRMYQSVKLGGGNIDIAKMKKMAKDLKEYVVTLPEVTYLSLTGDLITIKLGWRWISDNQMKYTPRYVPPITLTYNLKYKKFEHKGSRGYHPHCLSDGQVCLGAMANRMFNNIQEDFYIGIVKSMYEFGMTWSSDDAEGTSRAPHFCLKNYIEDKNIVDHLTDENIMLIINECRFRDVIGSTYFSKVRRRAEAILGGEIDLSSLCDTNYPKGKYFLIHATDETPEIKIKEQSAQTIEMPSVLEDNNVQQDGNNEA